VIRLIAADGAQRRSPAELEELLDGPGLVWIDVRYWDAETARLLSRALGLRQRAMRDCVVSSRVPKVHVYPDQVFLVLHALEQDTRGRVHYIELDQFVESNWLLTVHGPMDSEVSLDATYVETGSIARKLESARLAPAGPTSCPARWSPR
jgi:magnesium transporter